MYGLNDAARMWYFSVWEKLEELGCVRSSVDYGVFMRYEGEKLAGLRYMSMIFFGQGIHHLTSV